MLRVEHGKGHGSASWRTFEGISCARHRRASARSRQWSGEQRKKRKSGGQRGRREKKRRNNCCVAAPLPRGCNRMQIKQERTEWKCEGWRGREGHQSVRRRKRDSEEKERERERDRVVWRNSRPPFGLEHREKLALLLKKLGACYLAGISSINCAASLSRGLFLRVQPQWPRRLPTVNLTGILPRCKPINNFALL